MNKRVIILIAALILSICPVWAKKIHYSGKASVYSSSLRGHKTASGERYSEKSMTAASPTLPLGTKVVVRNKKNNRTALVRINDRGPFTRKRVLDLSSAAARKLGIHGVASVAATAVIE